MRLSVWVKRAWLISHSCVAAGEDIWSKLIKNCTVSSCIHPKELTVCVCACVTGCVDVHFVFTTYVLKYLKAMYKWCSYVCICFTWVNLSVSSPVLLHSPLCTSQLCLSCLFPLVCVCMPVHVCLWWDGWKLAVKWGDGSNVGQDWKQGDQETDPSALCNISSTKQLAFALGHYSPPAVQYTHTHPHTPTCAQTHTERETEANEGDKCT